MKQGDNMGAKTGKLTVVIPAYNEQDMVREAAERISEILNAENINFSLLFIDDGSQDNTWRVIEELSRNNNKVHGISFSRNFGKEAAIEAGLLYARGDCVAVMDCDLQHPANALISMYRLWQDGVEVIEGVKKSRGRESLIQKLGAKTFYGMISRATGVDMSRASDFKLLDRKAVDAINSMPEYHAFFRALSSWVGFRTGVVEFDVQDRICGDSKWSTKKLINYALNNISEFTAAPMQAITWIGGVFFVFATILGLQTFIKWIKGDAAAGFTTVILLVLLIGSMIMIALGIIGFYIAKIYDETKRRPKFIVSRKV